MYIMVGNFVYELQLSLTNWLLPLTQHPTLSKASRLVIFHTRDSLQHNPRCEQVGKSPNLIMPTILVGFSLGGAKNPPTMWFRSVSLPSIAKGSFKYAKLDERIERYIPPHHTGHEVSDMSSTKYTIQSVSVILQGIKHIMGESNNTPLTCLYDSCVLEHLELVEQRAEEITLFVVYQEKLKT